MQQLGAGVEDLLPLAELLHKAGIDAASFKELAAVFTAAAAASSSPPKQPAPESASPHSTWLDTLAQPPQQDVTPRHPAGAYSDQGAFTARHYGAAGQALHAGQGGQRLQLLQLPGADAAAHVTQACAGAGACGPAAAAVRDSSPPHAAGVHAVGDVPHTGWAGASAAPGLQQPPCVSPPSTMDGAACHQQQLSSPQSQQPGDTVLLPAQQQQQQQAQPDLDVRAEQQELDAHRQALAEQQWKLRELLVLLQESNPQEEQPEPHPEQPEEPLRAAAPAAAAAGAPQQQQPHSSNDSEAGALLLMAGTRPDTADQQDQQQQQQQTEEQEQEPLAAAVAAVVEYLAAAIRSAAADQASGAGEQGAAAADGAAAAAGGWAGGSAYASPTAAGARNACRALQWPAAEPTPFGAAAAHDEAGAGAAARPYSHGASAAAGGCDPHTPLDKLLQLAEVATQQGCGPAAAEGEAGEDEAAAEAAAPRWACSNEIWTSEDGLTVWPKDSPITPTPRVFYLTFKWVADHWPHSAAEASAASSTHVTATTAEFYLDGEETRVTMDVKVRLYNRAVHLVLSPYSKLSKAFPRKWLAGYAYDRARDRVRLYLASAKPLPPLLPAEPKAPRAPKVKPAPVSVDNHGYSSHEGGKQSARKRRRLDPWALHAAAAAAAGYPFPVPPYAHVGLGLPPMVPCAGRPGVGMPLTWSHPPAAAALGAHMPPAAAMVSCPPGVVMMQPHPYGPGPMLLPAPGGAVGGGVPGHYGYLPPGPLAGPQHWEQQQWLQEPGAQQLLPRGQQVMVQGRLLHPQQPEAQMQAQAAFLEHQQHRALAQEQQQQQQLMLLQQQTFVKQQTAVVVQPPYHHLPQQPQQMMPAVQLQHPAQQQEQQVVVVCEPLLSSQ